MNSERLSAKLELLGELAEECSKHLAPENRLLLLFSTKAYTPKWLTDWIADQQRKAMTEL